MAKSIDEEMFGEVPPFPDITTPFFRSEFVDVIQRARRYIVTEFDNLLGDAIAERMIQRTPELPWSDSFESVAKIPAFSPTHHEVNLIVQRIFQHQHYNSTARDKVTNHKILHQLWAIRLEVARSLLQTYRLAVRHYRWLEQKEIQ